MKYQNIVAYSSIIAAGLLGCKENTQKETPPEPPQYFATVAMDPHTGMALTSGDFDGDGDLDFIVGAKLPNFGGEAHLYLYLNDGKGNFTLKEPAKK